MENKDRYSLHNQNTSAVGAPFANLVYLKPQHGWLITSNIKCGVKLRIYAPNVYEATTEIWN